MRSGLLFACLLLMAATGRAQECECLWHGSFSDVAASTDLIVAARVAVTKGNSIDLATERTLHGELPGAELRVWLKAHDYCRPEVAAFPVGSRWVFALHEITEVPEGGFNPLTPNVSYGRVGDYRLSSCGGYWLKLEEDRVTGNLVNAPRWDREPKMTPVLLDVVADYVNGSLQKEQLLEASRADPALRDLMLDTRSFLRNDPP